MRKGLGVEKRWAAFSEKSKPGEQVGQAPALDAGAGEAARPRVPEEDWNFMPEADADVHVDNDAAMGAPAGDIYQKIDEVDVNDDNMIGKLVGIIQK